MSKFGGKDPEDHSSSGSSCSLLEKTPEFLQKGDEFNFLYHVKPVHIRTIPSLLSKESSRQNYRGFMNLCIALLFVNSVRLLIDGFRKNGVLIPNPFSDIPAESIYFAVVSSFSFLVHLLLSLGIERLRIEFSLWYSVYFFLVSLNVSVIFLHSTFLVWSHIRHYILGGIVLLFAVILTLKLISFHFVNQNLWNLHQHRKQSQIINQEVQDYLEKTPYPSNLTLKNVLYFWFAPTLCYQTHYPRTLSIRKSFVLKRLVELFCCLFIQHVLLHQLTLPEVQNSVQHLLQGNYLSILENILAISSTSLYCWLLMFFAFFQAYLNLLAELLKFGDREFYQDWWNASSLEEYWRLWNSPVHRWFKRHVYVPLRFKYGFSSAFAQILVFCISAILHEYLVAVPTHIVKFWSFWAIFSQAPLILILNWVLARFPNSSFGNYFFWFVLCIIGQPMCFVLYYKAAMSRESPNDLVFGLF